MSKIMIILFILISMVGCAPVDLNYQFPTSMAIEYKDDNFIVSVSIPSLEENSNKRDSEMSPLVIVRGRGNTLSKALEKVNLKEKGRISGVHIRSIIFHKSIFESNVISYDTICRYFIDSVEFRLNALVYITEESIDDLLSSQNPLTTQAFNNISDKTKSQYYNKYKLPTMMDTMIDYYENRDFYIPEVYLNDEAISTKKDDELNETKIYDLNNFCYIKDKMVCIDKELLNGLSFYHKITSNDIEVGEENEVVSALIKKIKLDIDYKNNTVLKLKAYISISDNLGNKTKEEIESIFEEQIKKYIIDTYDIAKSNDVDVYNIEDGYKRYKNKDIDIDNINIDVKVNIEITNSRLK